MRGGRGSYISVTLQAHQQERGKIAKKGGNARCTAERNTQAVCTHTPCAL